MTKRIGRPPKGIGKRQSYTFRMNEDARDALAVAALKNGRSLSEEIEFRVRQSIEAESQEEMFRRVLREERGLG